MTGFFIRVAAQSDQVARQLLRVANALSREGLPAQAILLRTIADALGRLSKAASQRPPPTHAHIATLAHDAHRGVRQCRGVVEIALSPDLPYTAELGAAERVLASLHRDALSSG